MLTKNGVPITSLDDWHRLARPKGDDQWRDHHGAKETARAWLAASPALPREIRAVLENHPDFGLPVTWHAEPDVQLRFDAFPDEPHNTDLFMLVKDRRGPYVVAVEANADETYGKTIAQERTAAVRRKRLNGRSNGERRIDQLESAIFAPQPDEQAVLGSLRYQLLTGTAGVLRAALDSNSARAVLLVQEFITAETKDAKHATNAADLDAFVARLTRGAIPKIAPACLHGPIRVPGSPLFDVVPDLYVGKVRRDIRHVGETVDRGR
jgi:hypothetical protein